MHAICQLAAVLVAIPVAAPRAAAAGLILAPALVVGAARAAGPPAQAARAAGWRGDWTGCEPNATPPVHWSPGRNLAWKSPLPAWSNSTPLLLDDRIVLTAEPDLLVCLRKSDGKLLWQQANSPQRLRPGGFEDYRRRALAGLDEQEKELQLKRELLDVTRRRLADPNSESLAARAAELRAAINVLALRRQALGHWRIRSIAPTAGMGWSCPTPVSDGRRVFALFHSGLGVCRDLEGKLLWCRLLRPRTGGYGQSSSPALVLCPAGPGIVGVSIDNDFFALDLATGRTLWLRNDAGHEASPAPLRACGMDVFVTAEGSVLRAADGHRLAALGPMRFTTPVADGANVYWLREDRTLCGSTLSRGAPNSPLAGPASETGRDEARPSTAPALTATPLHAVSLVTRTADTYYASPLVHGGLAWLVGSRGILKVVCLDSDSVIYEEPLELSGTCYASPAAAGRLVYVISDSGAAAVIDHEAEKQEIGPTMYRLKHSFRVLARNELGETMRASPLPEGERLYLRGFKNLWCFAAGDLDRRLHRPPPPGPAGRELLDGPIP